jgi:hypothetical protein
MPTYLLKDIPDDVYVAVKTKLASEKRTVKMLLLDAMIKYAGNFAKLEINDKTNPRRS